MNPDGVRNQERMAWRGQAAIYLTEPDDVLGERERVCLCVCVCVYVCVEEKT
jgi:hypothetical protein